ncbi:hypothetical protein BDV35DRAFT_374618 [Aspergillus flavus]|uniref:Uncharacterized protein n=1 Tax=Aspergillus flavus TaxID=5059 RepID=A0A5N6GFH4_ASPFL|nr:hypothetical protein BDV35DRAFT_374618 [Aspergillus flavus]
MIVKRNSYTFNFFVFLPKYIKLSSIITRVTPFFRGTRQALVHCPATPKSQPTCQTLQRTSWGEGAHATPRKHQRKKHNTSFDLA